MPMSEGLLKEFDNESKTTRRVLERVPTDKFEWAPHPRSMTMGKLANHIAEMTAWVPDALGKDFFDMAAQGTPEPAPATTEELLASFDRKAVAARAAIAAAPDEIMMKPWSLKRGEQVFFTLPKAAVLRTFVFNHVVHHRGQLTVYLRLNEIPVPSIYGPSADEQTF
ncbi:MAG: DinB family protein [Bryobacteraceae bacterium]